MKKIITLIIGILVVALSFDTTKIDTQVTNDIQNIEKNVVVKFWCLHYNRNDWSNFVQLMLVSIFRYVVSINFL